MAASSSTSLELQEIFKSIALELVVPDGSFNLPESFSEGGAEWLRALVQSLPKRDMAFFGMRTYKDYDDKRLRLSLTACID